MKQFILGQRYECAQKADHCEYRMLFLLSFPIRRQAYRAAHSSPISHRNHTSRLFQEVTFFEQTGFLYLPEV